MLLELKNVARLVKLVSQPVGAVLIAVISTVA
jgi:hypothetical protein